MIYTVTLNPAVDRELSVDKIKFSTVLRASEWRVDCGGKGFNVARMLKNLGVESRALGFAAGKSGEFLNESLNARGIATDFIWVAGETRTNISIVSSENDRYVKVNEPGPAISETDVDALLQKIKQSAHKGDWWILAGSLPPGVLPSIYTQMARIIQSAGAYAVIDTSDQSLKESCRVNPFMVKPNDVEAKALTGLNVGSVKELVRAGKAIRDMGPAHVVISLGKKGAILVNGKEVLLASSPEIVEQNPIGAGDSMVAGLVWGISQGASMSEALCRGIACGAATAGRKGTGIGTLDQVNTLLSGIKVSQL